MIRFPNTYVVYDTETTGLDVTTAEIIEIGAILVQNGEVVSEKSWLIKPREALPEKIVEITGITQALLDTEGRDAATCLIEFLDFAKNYPLVGHNIVRYDNPLLTNVCNRELGSLNGEAIFKNCVDTAALFKARMMGESQLWTETHQEFAKRILETYAKVSYRLSLAHEDLGFEPTEAHRALADCRMVNAIYREMTMNV